MRTSCACNAMSKSIALQDAKTAGFSVANLGEKALFLWYFLFLLRKKESTFKYKKIKKICAKISAKLKAIVIFAPEKKKVHLNIKIFR